MKTFYFLICFFLFLKYDFQKFECEVDMLRNLDKKKNENDFLKNTKKLNFDKKDENKFYIDCHSSQISLNNCIYCSKDIEKLFIYTDQDKVKKIELLVLPGSKSYFDIENFHFNKIIKDEANCSFHLKISSFVLEKVFLWLNIFLFFI